jgi:hypothetical protein
MRQSDHSILWLPMRLLRRRQAAAAAAAAAAATPPEEPAPEGEPEEPEIAVAEDDHGS